MTRLKRRPERTAGRLLLGVAMSALAAALAVPTALASPESDAADAIGQAWEAAGGSGSVVGSQDGDVYQVGSGFGQKFTGGAIFFTPDTGAHLMSGAILDKYQSLGGPADSDLGFPTIDEVPGLIGPDSRVSTFNASDKPAIFWTPDTGAWAVRGALNAAWDKLGGSAGTLGVPTEDERYDGDTVSQRFTGGELSWNSATKAFTTVPAELADSLAGLEVPTDATTLINLTWRSGTPGQVNQRRGVGGNLETGQTVSQFRRNRGEGLGGGVPGQLPAGESLAHRVAVVAFVLGGHAERAGGAAEFVPGGVEGAAHGPGAGVRRPEDGRFIAGIEGAHPAVGSDEAGHFIDGGEPKIAVGGTTEGLVFVQDRTGHQMGAGVRREEDGTAGELLPESAAHLVDITVLAAHHRSGSAGGLPGLADGVGGVALRGRQRRGHGQRCGQCAHCHAE